MKKWFYRNVVLVYVLAMASVIIGALCFIHQRVSEETFDALCGLALAIYFMVVASTVFIGIWGENKLKEMEKGELAASETMLLFIDSMQKEHKFKTGDRIKPVDSC